MRWLVELVRVLPGLVRAGAGVARAVRAGDAESVDTILSGEPAVIRARQRARARAVQRFRDEAETPRETPRSRGQ